MYVEAVENVEESKKKTIKRQNVPYAFNDL